MVNPIIFHVIRKRFANGLAGKMLFPKKVSTTTHPSRGITLSIFFIIA